LVSLMNGRDDSKLRERLCPSLPNKRARWAPWMAIIQRDRTYGVLTPRKHAVLTINSPHVRRKMPKDPAQCIGRLLRRVARARQPPRSHHGSIARSAFARRATSSKRPNRRGNAKSCECLRPRANAVRGRGDGRSRSAMLASTRSGACNTTRLDVSSTEYFVALLLDEGQSGATRRGFVASEA
jgi:hypothetical protein